MTTPVLSTAYGAAALDALRMVVAEAKRDDPMAPVTVLFPNNRAGIVARRHLAHGLTDAHIRALGSLHPDAQCRYVRVDRRDAVQAEMKSLPGSRSPPNNVHLN